MAGADGMVGRAVVEHCAACGDEVIPYNRQKMDITDDEAVSAVFGDERPEVVINCAAWTDVDGCESNPERAFAVNSYGVENLALNCRRLGAIFVTISTDYVFDGAKEGFYTQRDDPNPTSVYATAKLEGERRAQAASARTIVVRSGWIFGQGGRNFLSTIVERAQRGERLTTISDAFGTPTSAVDLAARLRELAELDLPGIYHVVNGGTGASFEEFTRAALKAASCETAEVETISMNALHRPAPRPRNSRLRCLLSEAIGLRSLRDWESALVAFIEQTVR